VINLKGVSKRFGNTTVLEQLDLAIQVGEFVTLIGPSGCGKSTLLKLISGLSPASSGSILVDGVTPAQARKSISYIFQDATLLPWRTVARNVGLGLELDHAGREATKTAVQSLLELVGLTHVANSYPRQLSGGMKMRVSVARALATTPRLLLMDEPFGALDPLTRAEMQDMLRDLLRRLHKTVLLVTHDLDEALYLASHIVLLEAGKVVANLPAQEFLTSQIPAVQSYVRAVHRGTIPVN
jgi:NitT/TauT family transport system ATP-binding protein